MEASLGVFDVSLKFLQVDFDNLIDESVKTTIQVLYGMNDLVCNFD